MRPVVVEIAVEQHRHERDHHRDRAAEARQLAAQAHEGLVGRIGVDREVRRPGCRSSPRPAAAIVSRPWQAVAEQDRFAGEDDRRPIEVESARRAARGSRTGRSHSRSSRPSTDRLAAMVGDEGPAEQRRRAGAAAPCRPSAPASRARSWCAARPRSTPKAATTASEADRVETSSRPAPPRLDGARDAAAARTAAGPGRAARAARAAPGRGRSGSRATRRRSAGNGGRPSPGPAAPASAISSEAGERRRRGSPPGRRAVSKIAVRPALAGLPPPC